MASLISGVEPKSEVLPDLKIVAGVAGSNRVALRFWEALFADVLACFPEADRAVFSGSVEGVMDPSRLDPHFFDLSSIEDDESTFTEVMKDIMLEAEVYGPPSPILCSFYSAGRIVAENKQLETDCADAGLLPFLVGWLLACCGIPLNALQGTVFTAELQILVTSPGQPRKMSVPVQLRITEISEGLHCWRLSADLASRVE